MSRLKIKILLMLVDVLLLVSVTFTEVPIISINIYNDSTVEQNNSHYQFYPSHSIGINLLDFK